MLCMNPATYMLIYMYVCACKYVLCVTIAYAYMCKLVQMPLLHATFHVSSVFASLSFCPALMSSSSPVLFSLFLSHCRYFTQFMDLIHSLNRIDWSKLSPIHMHSLQRHVSQLKEATIRAMAYMLTANIDSGLTHAIGKIRELYLCNILTAQLHVCTVFNIQIHKTCTYMYIHVCVYTYMRIYTVGQGYFLQSRMLADA